MKRKCLGRIDGSLGNRVVVNLRDGLIELELALGGAVMRVGLDSAQAAQLEHLLNAAQFRAWFFTRQQVTSETARTVCRPGFSEQH